MSYRNVAAIDLGASSGRAILGSFDGRRVALSLIDRFENFPVVVGEHLKWPIFYLAQRVIAALSKAPLGNGGEVASIGIDTWGVDFGLIGEDGDLCLTPHHYRDHRTETILPFLDSEFGIERLFELTGISYQPFNTSLQLLALSRYRPHIFERAQTFLMIPDLLTFLLTGERGAEYTNAGTTQLAAWETRSWAPEVLDAFKIPASIMPSIHRPGTQSGKILPSVGEPVGLTNVPVISVASHDTASAVATQILPSDSTIFISSGTWSLVGAVNETPVTGAGASEARFSNEWMHDGKFMFLKNIVGLWLLQECRKEWEREGTRYSYEDISALAAKSPSFRSLINPDNTRFYAPVSMSRAIQSFCDDTGQPIPDSPGQIARTIYESLALDYRATIDEIEHFTNHPYSRIYVVGGGARDESLNKFIASATGRPVVTGASEASALGNVLVQLYGIGEIGSFDDFRSVIEESVQIRTFDPQASDAWDAPFESFLQIKNHDE